MTIATAISRLEKISQSFDEALVLNQIIQRPSFDKDLQHMFDNTYAAHVFLVVRDQLHFSGLLAIARVWDATSGAQSLPNLLPALRSPKVLKSAIAARRTECLAGYNDPKFIGSPDEAKMEAMRSLLTRDADEAEKNVRSIFPLVIQEIEAVMNDSLRESLKNFRDKNLAHSLEQTVAEKERGPIKSVKHGDLELLVAKTIPILEKLNHVLRGAGRSYKSSEEIWTMYSDDYWAAVTVPDSRPKAPKRPSVTAE